MKVGPREASLPSGQVAEPSVNLAPRRFVLGNPRSQLKCTTRADPAIQRARFGSSHPAILAPHETAADSPGRGPCGARLSVSPYAGRPRVETLALAFRPGRAGGAVPRPLPEGPGGCPRRF